MKSNYTHISIVLDRSGSMQSVWDDTIGGFNSFLESQQKLPGECTISAIQFDDHYEPLYTTKPVAEAQKLTRETYVPRGSTALLDAIGRTIVDTGTKLAALPEDQRPSKVLFVILTDGHENASREYNRAKVFEMIKLQRETYKWDFVFLGANQNAISAGASMGIAAGSSMTYASNAGGTKAVFTSASNYAARARAGVSNNSFSDQDRQDQQNAGAAS